VSRRSAARQGQRNLLRSVGGGVVAVVVVGAGVAITNLVGVPAAAPSTPVVLLGGAGQPGGAAGARTASAPQLSTLGTGTPLTAATDAGAVPSSIRSPTAPATTAPAITVAVLNDSRISGLAHRVAAQLSQAGWRVAAIGNLPGATLPASTLYYRGGGAAAAARLAASERGIQQVLAAPSWLPGSSTLVLVLTRYFPAA
jgi:LytR cell envelope-related transcriptional attenuator